MAFLDSLSMALDRVIAVSDTSHEELAEKAGIDLEDFRKILDGSKPPSLAELSAILEALPFDPLLVFECTSDLAGGKEPIIDDGSDESFEHAIEEMKKLLEPKSKSEDGGRVIE